MTVELRDVMLNVLARLRPVATPLRRLRERTKGYDLDRQVNYTIEMLRVRQAFMGADLIRGATMMEIGSGQTFGLALLLLGLGAKRIINVEIAHYRFIDDITFYRTLIERAAAQGLPVSWPPRGIIVNPDGKTVKPDPAYITMYLGKSAATIAEPDQSVDVTFSVAVFEHIRPEAMRSVISELARLTRPGGRGFHRIDMADHYYRKTEPYRLLNLSQRDYERMYSHRFSYSNRFRTDDFERFFREQGFSEVRFDDIKGPPNEANFDRWRQRFHPDFSSRPTEVLRALSAMLILTR